MKIVKTYREFESFVPKKVTGRKEEFRKIQETKIQPFMRMLQRMFIELGLTIGSIENIDERITPSKKKVIDMIINRERIGKTNYEEFLMVTITDSSTKEKRKTRINITKEMNNTKSYSPSHLDANLATYEFSTDEFTEDEEIVLSRRLNG